MKILKLCPKCGGSDFRVQNLQMMSYQCKCGQTFVNPVFLIDYSDELTIIVKGLWEIFKDKISESTGIPKSKLFGKEKQTKITEDFKWGTPTYPALKPKQKEITIEELEAEFEDKAEKEAKEESNKSIYEIFELENPGKHAVWHGQRTKQFKDWLDGRS